MTPLQMLQVAFFHTHYLFIWGFYVTFNTAQVKSRRVVGAEGGGNQYIQLVRVLYGELPTNGKQPPAFPLEAMLGTEPHPQRWFIHSNILFYDNVFTLWDSYIQDYEFLPLLFNSLVSSLPIYGPSEVPYLHIYDVTFTLHIMCIHRGSVL